MKKNFNKEAADRFMQEITEAKDYKYIPIEEATANADKKGGRYVDIPFTGVVRIFGTADAFCDEYDEYAYEGEDFDAFQVRMTLEEKLDIDLVGESRRAWYRPFSVSTYSKVKIEDLATSPDELKALLH